MRPAPITQTRCSSSIFNPASLPFLSRRPHAFLVGVHVESREDDGLLLAGGGGEGAVLVDASDASGVEPSVAERERRLLGSLVVAVRQVRSAEHELAGLADEQIARSGLGVHDLRV